MAEQVEAFEKTVKRDVKKVNLIIEQMINPTDFKGSLDNYPITWDDAVPLGFSRELNERPEAFVCCNGDYNNCIPYDSSQCIKLDTLSFDFVSCSMSTTPSASSENYAKIITNFLELWKMSYATGYGSNHDVEIKGIIFYYFEQLPDRCESMMIKYPATSPPPLDRYEGFTSPATCDSFVNYNYYQYIVEKGVPNVDFSRGKARNVAY